MDEVDVKEGERIRNWLIFCLVGAFAAIFLFLSLWSLLALIPLLAVAIPAALFYVSTESAQSSQKEEDATPATPAPEPSANEGVLPSQIKSAVDAGDWERVAALVELARSRQLGSSVRP